MTLAQLCDAMITVSSNFAANLLIEKTRRRERPSHRQRARCGRHAGASRRGGPEGFDKGLNNTTTARGLMVLLDRIAHGRAVDAQSDAAMIEILKRQTFNDAIPAGLPTGTPVAHKTGNITRIHHDAAIVYASRPYVLVLLVRESKTRRRARRSCRNCRGRSTAPPPADEEQKIKRSEETICFS
jgi:beta-lactamase class A